MLILGIETSCDETSASVVEDGDVVLSSIVHSQEDVHARWGGIVPELACREHVQKIRETVEGALLVAGTGIGAMSAIAVANRPGLIGSLLVGVEFAKSLAWSAEVPLIDVHHLEAHIYANFLCHPEIELPLVSLVVSGGHTAYYLSRSKIDHEMIGSTIDDAVGEAFDKVAKMLGLGYPGGPAIDKIAGTGKPDAYDFPRTFKNSAHNNLSFSGLKTAVLYRLFGPEGKDRRTVPPDEAADVAASFQEAVVDVTTYKLLRAAQETGARSVGIAGGVAANSRIRKIATERAAAAGLPVYMPSMELCTDNAAMVAGLGFHLFKAGLYDSDYEVNADPTPIRAE